MRRISAKDFGKFVVHERKKRGLDWTGLSQLVYGHKKNTTLIADTENKTHGFVHESKVKKFCEAFEIEREDLAGIFLSIQDPFHKSVSRAGYSPSIMISRFKALASRNPEQANKMLDLLAQAQQREPDDNQPP